MRVTPADLGRAAIDRAALADRVAIADDSSRVGSPRYFMSCGAAPIEANWKMRLSLPIAVGPSITTCGPTSVPAPIVTPGPDDAVRADLDVRRYARAAGAMSAVRVDAARDQRWPPPPSSRRFGRRALPSTSATVENARCRAAALERRLENELVAGQHRAAEARLVDADEIEHRACSSGYRQL